MTPTTLTQALVAHAPAITWQVTPSTLFWQVRGKLTIKRVVYTGTIQIAANRFEDEQGQRAAITYILADMGRQIGQALVGMR